MKYLLYIIVYVLIVSSASADTITQNDIVLQRILPNPDANSVSINTVFEFELSSARDGVHINWESTNIEMQFIQNNYRFTSRFINIENYCEYTSTATGRHYVCTGIPFDYCQGEIYGNDDVEIQVRTRLEDCDASDCAETFNQWFIITESTTSDFVIEEHRVQAIDDDSAIITWSANALGTGYVEYRKAGTSSYQQQEIDDDRYYDAYATINNLDADSSYEYIVHAEDRCGNMRTASGSFHTSKSPRIGAVQGDIIDGNILILSGQNFGSRIIASDSFFETWDWGENNQFLEDVPGSPWDNMNHQEGVDDAARFSNEALRDFQGLNAKTIRPDPFNGDSLNDIVQRNDLNVQNNDKVYISGFLWSTYGGAQEYGSGCPQQWKMWNYLMHPYGGALGSPGTGITWNAASTPDENGPNDPLGSPHAWVAHQCEDGTAGSSGFSWTYQPPEETWFQIEMEQQIASGKAAIDGRLKVWFDGTLYGDTLIQHYCEDIHEDHILEDGYVYNTMMLRNYIQWSGDTCNSDETRDTDIIRFDDIVYQRGSWARVMICDSPTWESCTVKEYQPVEAWSDDYIQISLNLGGFQSGDNMWLYVVDDDGDVSNSYPLSLDLNCGDGDCAADESYWTCSADCPATIDEFVSWTFTNLRNLMSFGRDFSS